MDKPKYTIRNFNKDNIYWLRGMLPVTVAGNSVLTNAYRSNYLYDSEDIPILSEISSINAMDLFFLDDEYQFGDNPYFAMGNGSNFYLIRNEYVSANAKNFNKVHIFRYPNSESFDLKVTGENNIIYSGDEYLGIGYYFKATAATATSLTVDDIDFRYLGVSTDQENKYIYDFHNGANGTEYEVTSITGGASISHFTDQGDGLVGVTATGHGKSVGDGASISGTSNYDGNYTVIAVTGDRVDITHSWDGDDATGMIGGDILNFTAVYDNYDITSFADAGGGYVTVTTSEDHYLKNNNRVTISSTTNYDGSYDVDNVSDTTFRITHSWDGDDATGSVSEIPDTGNEFMVFVDNKWSFGVDDAEYHEHFYGQRQPSNWRRQIQLLGDDYFIGNGNYLSSLNIDESTFAAEAKQLPYLTHFKCMNESNGKLLVGGNHKNGRGRLMLWDGWTSGWLSILDIAAQPISIISYNQGWLVACADSGIYYTDGYSTRRITLFPDGEIKKGRIFADLLYGMIIKNDIIFISVYPSTEEKRIRGGVYCYDIKQDIWSFIPIKDENGYPTKNTYYPRMLFDVSTKVVGVTDYSPEIWLCHKNVLGYITEGLSLPYSEAWLKIQLPYAQKINKIGLNLGISYHFTSYGGMDDNSTNVVVSVGDGRRPISQRGSIGNDSTVSNLVPYSDDVRGLMKVGNEIEIMADYVANAGDYTIITAINDYGEATENWDVSPPISIAPTADSTTCSLYHVKHCGTETISLGDVKETIFNVPDFFGDTILLHIRIGDTDENSNYLDINSINVY